MNLATLKGITIPEGTVKRLTINGQKVWEKVTVSGTPTAILYSDGALVFQANDAVDGNHGAVVETYTGWDTAYYNRSTMAPWYSQLSSITSVSSKGNVPVAHFAYWFYGYSNLESVDFSGIDISGVRSIRETFYNCSNLKSIFFGNQSANSLTDLYNSFYGCTTLTSLDISSFNTGNIKSMNGMFRNCKALTSLDLSGFNTGNVTDMGYMFVSCSQLIALDISGFDTNKVTDTTSMFRSCSAPGLIIYVGNDDMVTWVKSTSGFPTTATVVVGSMN